MSQAIGEFLSFAVGWIAGLAAVGTIILLLAGGASASEQGEPADWVNALKLALGVLLLGIALEQWRERPRDRARGRRAGRPPGF